MRRRKCRSLILQPAARQDRALVLKEVRQFIETHQTMNPAARLMGHCWCAVSGYLGCSDRTCGGRLLEAFLNGGCGYLTAERCGVIVFRNRPLLNLGSSDLPPKCWIVNVWAQTHTRQNEILFRTCLIPTMPHGLQAATIQSLSPS